MKACKCGSYAINHHCHGRDGSDDDLCDVCYWRKRAEQPAQQCKWPTCQSEEFQQALAEQIKRELVGEQPTQQQGPAPGEMELSLRRNHKDELFECRRRFSAEEVMHGPDFMVEATASNLEVEMDRAIREWSNT